MTAEAQKLTASILFWVGRALDGLTFPNEDVSVRIASDAADMVSAQAQKLASLLRRAESERQTRAEVTATRAMFRAALPEKSPCGPYLHEKQGGKG